MDVGHHLVQVEVSLLGLADEAPSCARLTASYSKKGPLRLFLKARTQLTADGTVEIELPAQPPIDTVTKNNCKRPSVIRAGTGLPNLAM